MNSPTVETPINASQGVGEDPRYLDEFEAIKIEVEKLSGSDFDLIEKQARYILTEHAKDLRVAGFLLLALCYQKGCQGLVEGLDIYQTLLRQFGGELHPQRQAARVSAIKWLNQPRLLSFIKQEQISSSKMLTGIRQAISQINQLITSHFDEGTPHFTILNSYLNEQKITETPKSKVSQLVEKLKPASSSSGQAFDAIQIEDQKQYGQLVKKCAEYQLKDENWLQGICLSRTMRWQSLVMPEHDDYKTQVVAVRKEARQGLEKVLDAQDMARTLKHVEAMFLESSHHYFLDLQYHADQALIALEQFDASAYLRLSLKQLLSRLPELPFCYFQDDKPFASEEVRLWLSELSQQQSKAEQTEGNSSGVEYYLAYAQKRANSTRAKDKIMALEALNVSNELERFQKQFAIAQLAQAKHKELASSQYQLLVEKIEQLELDKWLPELCLDVLKRYHQLLKGNKDGHQQYLKISQWLCALSPSSLLL